LMGELIEESEEVDSGEERSPSGRRTTGDSNSMIVLETGGLESAPILRLGGRRRFEGGNLRSMHLEKGKLMTVGDELVDGSVVDFDQAVPESGLLAGQCMDE
jgi:hypothetical protein